MTKKEYTERNIGMTFDFIRQIIDHPEIIDTIPDNAELDFISVVLGSLRSIQKRPEQIKEFFRK